MVVKRSKGSFKLEKFVSKYALFINRRFHEAAENVYVVKVNYKKLTHVTPGSENSLNAEALNQLGAEIEDNIEKLHENLRREGVGAEYHVFYTLLGSDEFPAKFAETCTQGVLHRRPSRENFEYAEFGDLQNFENFENLGIGGHTREVGAEIDLGTSLEIYRYAKENIEDKNALEAEKEKLEKQLNELEELKTQIYMSQRIQGLHEKAQELKKRRREHLRGCLQKLEEGVKKFRDALLPEG
eukprot:jgi/Picre1/29035/NNA_004429.t1